MFTPFEVLFEANNSIDLERREDHQYAISRSEQSYLDKYMTHFRLRSSVEDASTFDDFIHHLSFYTGRSLGVQSDILNAFQDILTSLYPGDMGLYGLPEADFDQGMLWRCIEEHKNRPALNETWFPSWSWASGNKRAKASRPISQKFEGALVRRAYKNRNGELQPIKQNQSPKPQRGSDANEHITPQICLLLAWWKGYIEAAIQETLQRMVQGHYPECEPGIVHLWPRLEDVWQAIKGSRKDVLEEDQDLNIGLKEEDQGLIDRLRPGVLLTRAQTAMFKASKDKSISTLDDYRMGIINSKSKRVGSVGTEPEVRNIELNSKRRGGLCKFMAISLSTEHRILLEEEWLASNLEVRQLIGRLISLRNQREFRGRW